jgi:hypothetical protein
VNQLEKMEHHSTDLGTRSDLAGFWLNRLRQGLGLAHQRDARDLAAWIELDAKGLVSAPFEY